MRTIKYYLTVALIVCLAAVPARGANDFSSDSHIRAIWDFESSALTDDSKCGNDLTNNGGVSDSDSKIGSNSVYLNGTNLTIADADLDVGFPTKSGDVDGSFTVFFWFKSSSSTQTIISKWDEANNKRSWRLRIQSRLPYLDIGHTNGTDVESKLWNRFPLYNDKWYFVGLSFNTATKMAAMIYWDDDAQSIGLYSSRRITYTNSISITDAPLVIGGDNSNGKIDGIVVFNRGLSIPEMHSVRLGIWGTTNKTWYIRPERKAKYGTGDGMSYVNAFDGIRGMPQVPPGSDIYVCGAHRHKLDNGNDVTTQHFIFLPKGEEGYPITIRGDFASDPGMICCRSIESYRRWVQQPAPNHNVWAYGALTGHYDDHFFYEVNDLGNYSPTAQQGCTDNHVLTKVSGIAECQAAPGSQYSDTYTSGGTLYVHCRDGLSPENRIYSSLYGYNLIWNAGPNHVVLKNLKMPHFSLYTTNVRPTHGTIDGCTMAASQNNCLSLFTGMHHWHIINCDISWYPNAIYTISSDNTNAPSWFVFADNHIHDIGVYPVKAQNSDAHSIGIQGGRGGRIYGNTIWNCGTGPVFHAGTNQVCKDHWVYNNLVRDLHTLDSANSWGIGTTCNNDSLSDKSGHRYWGNVIINCAIGLRGQWEDLMEMSNNVIINCARGFYANRTVSGMGPVVKLRNNIFYHSGTPASFLHYGTGGTVGFDADFNLFNKTGPGWFDGAGAPPGEHDVIGDPLFTNVTGDAPDDFKLRSGSPAIGKGEAAAWLTVDFFDNKYLSPPSMGIHEAGSAPAGPLGIPAAFGPFPGMAGRGGARR